jgi:hypothetical protein
VIGDFGPIRCGKGRHGPILSPAGVVGQPVVQRYRLELTVRGIPAPIANVTLRPGHDLPMRLLRRE